MRTIIFAAMFVVGLSGSALAQSNLYVIGLAGQSNAVGHGKVSEWPASRPVNPKIWVFANSWKWWTAQEPIDSARKQVDKVSEDKSAGVGPSLAAAQDFLAANPALPGIAIVPCPKGGSKMSQWGRAFSRSTLYGSCANRMLTAAKPAGNKIRAMIWWQGAADANAGVGEASKYLSRLTSMSQSMRSDLKAPDLMFIIVVGAPKYGVSGAGKLVRDAQLSFAGKPGYCLVYTKDDDATIDGAHYTTAAQIEIGAKIAGCLPK